jgi:predicted negative regulator of RcsB-dependent stress response
MLLPIAKGVYEGGLYTEVGDASLVALCLGDLYASSGQKVLARRFWNEAVRLDGNSIAQERLAAL